RDDRPRQVRRDGRAAALRYADVRRGGVPPLARHRARAVQADRERAAGRRRRGAAAGVHLHLGHRQARHAAHRAAGRHRADGDRGVLHAIRAARAINEELTSLEDVRMSIGVGIATGQFVTGGVTLTQDIGLAVVGTAPLLAMLFAWHAPTGYAYVSYETAQTAGGEIMSSANREQVQLRWIPQPLPVASFPLVALTTNMMRAIGHTSSSMATMRIG